MVLSIDSLGRQINWDRSRAKSHRYVPVQMSPERLTGQHIKFEVRLIDQTHANCNSSHVLLPTLDLVVLPTTTSSFEDG